MFHTLVFCCLCCCCLVGVCADTDAVKSVSVMEGDSVTLNSSLTDIQRGDRIFWTFGTNGALIATITEAKSETPKGLDKRFRDRLKLDNKTGSLTIMNITANHAGVYEVEISRSSRSETKHRFNVTVYAPLPVISNCVFCCHVSEAVTRLVISALVGVAAACIVVYDITSRKVEQERT